MQIVLHVNGYYDWEPVPADVQVTDEDIKAKRVKPAQGGQWLMKVEKTADTETAITIPEDEIFALIAGEMTRGDRRIMTREELAHRYATRYHLDHNTHPDWIQEVIVHDDGPNEAGLRDYLATHVACGNIQARDVDRIVAKYMEPSTPESHAAHFHKSYGVTPDRVEAERTRRHAHHEARATAHAAHLASVHAAKSETKKGAHR